MARCFSSTRIDSFPHRHFIGSIQLASIWGFCIALCISWVLAQPQSDFSCVPCTPDRTGLLESACGINTNPSLAVPATDAPRLSPTGAVGAFVQWKQRLERDGAQHTAQQHTLSSSTRARVVSEGAALSSASATAARRCGRGAAAADVVATSGARVSRPMSRFSSTGRRHDPTIHGGRFGLGRAGVSLPVPRSARSSKAQRHCRAYDSARLQQGAFGGVLTRACPSGHSATRVTHTRACRGHLVWNSSSAALNCRRPASPLALPSPWTSERLRCSFTALI